MFELRPLSASAIPGALAKAERYRLLNESGQAESICQDVCHVLRDHKKHEQFIGPRYLVYAAALEMHPLDVEDRVADLKNEHGIGYCNITKCCTAVCPESITITDNAIIPLKERVVDRFYDPVSRLLRMLKS